MLGRDQLSASLFRRVPIMVTTASPTQVNHVRANLRFEVVVSSATRHSPYSYAIVGNRYSDGEEIACMVEITLS